MSGFLEWLIPSRVAPNADDMIRIAIEWRTFYLAYHPKMRPMLEQTIRQLQTLLDWKGGPPYPGLVL